MRIVLAGVGVLSLSVLLAAWWPRPPAPRPQVPPPEASAPPAVTANPLAHPPPLVPPARTEADPSEAEPAFAPARGGAIRVRFLRAEDGAPAAGVGARLRGVALPDVVQLQDGAEYWEIRRTAEAGGSARSDADGVVVLPLVPGDAVAVELLEPYLAIVSSSLIDAGAEDAEHEVLVRAAGRVRGRIVDALGRPVEGAWVGGYQDRIVAGPPAGPPFSDPCNIVSARSAADGSFE